MILGNKRILSITLILILILGVLTACGPGGDKAEANKNIVARVNGEEIDYESFQKNFSIVERIYNQQYTENIWSQEIKGKTVKTVLEIVKAQILDKLIMEELIRQEANKKDIIAEESKVEEIYDNFKQGLEKDEEFKKFYEENNLDEAFVKGQIKTEIIISEYEKALFEEIGLDDEKLKEITEDKDYVVKVSVQHILVEDEKLAKEIITKIKAGEDFTALAKKYSEDPNLENDNGNLGYFTRGEKDLTFQDASFALNVGEISEPVKTEYGYHIIKVDDKKAIGNLEQELSEEELAIEKNYAKAAIKRDKFIRRIEELKAQANIETFEENLK